MKITIDIDEKEMKSLISGTESRTKPVAKYRYQSPPFIFINHPFKTCEAAVRVRNQMLQVYEEYGIATVATFYDLRNQCTANYKDNTYGWLLNEKPYVRETAEGWLIDFKDPLPITDVKE